MPEYGRKIRCQWDVGGVEYGHHMGSCSVEYFIAKACLCTNVNSGLLYWIKFIMLRHYLDVPRQI